MGSTGAPVLKILRNANAPIGVVRSRQTCRPFMRLLGSDAGGDEAESGRRLGPIRARSPIPQHYGHGDSMARARRGVRDKGNINASGERIYHLPGQRYYNATQIDTSKGERWFCSEEDAVAAGWRRAKSGAGLNPAFKMCPLPINAAPPSSTT